MYKNKKGYLKNCEEQNCIIIPYKYEYDFDRKHV